MPSIKDNSTVQAIARIFCGEGKRNKTNTMIAVGYDEGYSNSGKGHKTVYENIRVKEAIAAIDAKGAEKQERTIASLDLMYAEAYALAKKCNQPAAMNGAVTGIARLYGMDKDAGSGHEAAPKPLTESEIEQLKAMARAVTGSQLRLTA